MGSAKEALSSSSDGIASRSLNPTAESERRIDRAIEILLFALIAFVPWPLGSATAWAQEVVVVFSALLAGCFAAKLLIARETRLVRSWTYLPIALFVSLALFQLLPLPHSVLRIISPNTLETKSRLLADLPGAADGSMPLTFYANATRNNLRLLLACVVVFVVALNVLRTPGRIRRSLIAISVVGGLVILLALAQDLTGTQKIYWTIVRPIPFALGGPFTGHNSLPLIVNLTIGASVALLMLMRADRRMSRSAHGPMPVPRIAAICALFAVIALGACAVFLSLSRSGIIALGAASLCIAVVAAVRWRQGLERSLLWVCVLVCLAISFYVASDSVNRRMASLQHPVDQYGVRWQIVKDILGEARQFPLFGTGLGTHEVVYPMFQHVVVTGDFDHAENEFAQMLEETGAIGLAAIILFVGIVIVAFFRAVRKCTHLPIGATTFGLGLGLLAIVIQSCFGFGEHFAANAVVTCVECALLLNVARLVQHKRAAHGGARSDARVQNHSTAGGFALALRVSAALVVLFAFVPAIVEADRARRADAEFQPAREVGLRYAAGQLVVTDDDYDTATESAHLAHLIEPDDIKYYYWQAAYHWQRIELHHDPNVSDDIRSDEEKSTARRLTGTFDEVRKLAPTFGDAVFMDGQLRYVVLDEPQGYDLLRLAASLAPNIADESLQLASVDCDRGDFSGAMEASRHYLALYRYSPESFAQIADMLIVHDAKRPDLAMELAGDDPQRQLIVVDELHSIPDRTDYQTLAAKIEKTAKVARRNQLIDRCAQPDVSALDLAALAEVYRSEHDLNHSIDCYQRALAKEYDRTDWHLNLAKVLFAAGRVSEAVDEASICLRQQPHMAAAEQLIAGADAHGATADKP